MEICATVVGKTMTYVVKQKITIRWSTASIIGHVESSHMLPSCSHHTSIYCENMFSKARNTLINGGNFSVHNMVQNHGLTTIGTVRDVPMREKSLTLYQFLRWV